MHERKLPPLGYQCCDPRGGYEGCCGLFIKTKLDPTKPTSCGQCAHLMKTVEDLQRQLRIEPAQKDAVDAMDEAIRRLAGIEELTRDNLNLREELNNTQTRLQELREDYDNLEAVALQRGDEIYSLRKRIKQLEGHPGIDPFADGSVR